MTLGEYLNKHKSIKNFCILTLTDNDRTMVIEFRDVSEVDHDLLHCEFMEENVDDGTLGIWVR